MDRTNPTPNEDSLLGGRPRWTEENPRQRGCFSTGVPDGPNSSCLKTKGWLTMDRARESAQGEPAPRALLYC